MICWKTLGPQLELLNKVLIGAQQPSEWKSGDVALILKKPLRTDINNYRPITLISCVSKLLTKILAKRLSVELDKEDMAGAEWIQSKSSLQGQPVHFEHCFGVQQKQETLSHLLFVDLKEGLITGFYYLNSNNSMSPPRSLTIWRTITSRIRSPC